MINKLGVSTYQYIDRHLTEFLTFVKYKHKNKKTFEIEVENKNFEVLGEIKWSTGWRRYIFYPCTGTFYDSKCFKDITEYLDTLMEDRKNG